MLPDHNDHSVLYFWFGDPTPYAAPLMGCAAAWPQEPFALDKDSAKDVGKMVISAQTEICMNRQMPPRRGRGDHLTIWKP